VGAFGRILNADVAHRIAGLAAAQYLAVPGAVLPGLSQIPMMRVLETDDRVTKLLFERGREVVHDALWQTAGVTDPTELKRIRETNDAFLTRDAFPTHEIRMWRWAPAGGKPLLLVEAVWIDEDRKLPLFAVDAVLKLWR